jgi:hypothetical protein
MSILWAFVCTLHSCSLSGTIDSVIWMCFSLFDSALWLWVLSLFRSVPFSDSFIYFSLLYDLYCILLFYFL